MSPRSIEGLEYLPIRPVAVGEAVGQGWGVGLGIVSPGTPAAWPPPFFAHDLAFQFAWWGASFFVSPQADRPTPPLMISSLRRATVLGADGVVVAANGVCLAHHVQFLQWSRPGSLLRQKDGELWRPDLEYAGLPASDHSGRTLMGFTPAWSNHAHWLNDTLPLWAWYADQLKPLGVRLLVGPLSPVQSEALALLGIGADDVLHADGVMRFEDLLMPSEISLWEPPKLVRETALRMVSAVGAGPRSGRRLYLSRRDAEKRRLINDDAVEALLRARGFEMVLCSRLGFAEQVACLAEAAIVVGCHGAALANTMFCQPGCHIIELFPEYCAQPQVRVMAAQAGCPYGYIMGTSFDGEDSRGTQTAWDADFVLDTSVLVRALDAAGIQIDA